MAGEKSFPHPKSGGERAALQTLRAVQRRPAFAKRLECGSFSTAFVPFQTGGATLTSVEDRHGVRVKGTPLCTKPTARGWEGMGPSHALACIGSPGGKSRND